MIFVMNGLENAPNCHCNKSSVMKDQLTLKVRALLCVPHISENYYLNWVEAKRPLLCLKKNLVWMGPNWSMSYGSVVASTLEVLRSHHTLLLKLKTVTLPTGQCVTINFFSCEQ